MKAKDLMIGDWVYIHHGGKATHYGKVTALPPSGAIESEIDGSHALSSSVEPIPITPEFLEKNFRVVERSSDGYNLVINSELILAFHLKATLDFWIAQPRDCPNLTYSLPLPRYVHELQHCLKLVGIKKDIVL